MLALKVFAEGGSRNGATPSTNATADDRAYTAWANTQAAAAGVRNPSQYVSNNVSRNAGPASRNRTMGAINRRGRR